MGNCCSDDRGKSPDYVVSDKKSDEGDKCGAGSDGRTLNGIVPSLIPQQCTFSITENIEGKWLVIPLNENDLTGVRDRYVQNGGQADPTAGLDNTAERAHEMTAGASSPSNIRLQSNPASGQDDKKLAPGNAELPPGEMEGTAFRPPVRRRVDSSSSSSSSIWSVADRPSENNEESTKVILPTAVFSPEVQRPLTPPCFFARYGSGKGSDSCSDTTEWGKKDEVGGNKRETVRDEGIVPSPLMSFNTPKERHEEYAQQYSVYQHNLLHSDLKKTFDDFTDTIDGIDDRFRGEMGKKPKKNELFFDPLGLQEKLSLDDTDSGGDDAPAEITQKSVEKKLEQGDDGKKLLTSDDSEILNTSNNGAKFEVVFTENPAGVTDGSGGNLISFNTDAGVCAVEEKSVISAKELPKKSPVYSGNINYADESDDDDDDGDSSNKEEPESSKCDTAMVFVSTNTGKYMECVDSSRSSNSGSEGRCLLVAVNETQKQQIEDCVEFKKGARNEEDGGVFFDALLPTTTDNCLKSTRAGAMPIVSPPLMMPQSAKGNEF